MFPGLLACVHNPPRRGVTFLQDMSPPMTCLAEGKKTFLYCDSLSRNRCGRCTSLVCAVTLVIILPSDRLQPSDEHPIFVQHHYYAGAPMRSKDQSWQTPFARKLNTIGKYFASRRNDRMLRPAAVRKGLRMSAGSNLLYNSTS